MNQNFQDEKLIVCLTGDIDYFNSETFECLDSYFIPLKKHGVKAEFFITAKAASEYPERVEHIIKHHHIVGGHGDVHEAFYDSVSKQTERMLSMKKVFLDYFDLEIEGFRAPWYKHNQNTYQSIDEAGLTYDCSKKRFEIAFKRIPYFQKRYMYTKLYPFTRTFLKFIGLLYNQYCNAPRVPYKITPKVIEFPTLGISDYSLIGDPLGPQYSPHESKKIADIWIECLNTLRQRGGGVMTIQAHPGRMSPEYVDSLDLFIQNAKQMGALFSTPNELCQYY